MGFISPSFYILSGSGKYDTISLVGNKLEKSNSILVFGDRHSPYDHLDAYDFICAIAEKYNPKKYIDLGDTEDNHSISYHEHSPNLKSHNDELEAIIEINQKWYKKFPNLDILASNHGSLIYRQGATAGLAERCLRTVKEIIGAPVGWNYHERLILEEGKFRILFKHKVQKNYLLAAQKIGACIMQGHFHSQAGVQFFTNELGEVRWAASCPCLIDINNLEAYKYNKSDVNRPILGAMIIENGFPKIILMPLDKKNRWTGDIKFK
jgi:hypothetical protein